MFTNTAPRSDTRCGPLEASKVLDAATKELLITKRLHTSANSLAAASPTVVLREFYTLDQFADTLKYIPKRYAGPNAFCGATSVANALALLEGLDAMGLFVKDAKAAVSGTLLMDIARNTLCPASTPGKPPTEGDAIVCRFEDAMSHYATSRNRYIAAYPDAFDAAKRKRRGSGDRLAYRRNWIANYEISDYLREKVRLKKTKGGTQVAAPKPPVTSAAVPPPSGGTKGDAIDVDDLEPTPVTTQQPRANECNTTSDNIGRLVFFRKNQWPVREYEASHEEYTRMEEERRFGGVITNPQTGEVVFKAEDCSVFVELPEVEALMKPREYLNAAHTVEWNITVGVVDLDGHFATIATFRDADNGGAVTSILFNTVKGYSTHPMFVACHDLLATPKL